MSTIEPLSTKPQLSMSEATTLGYASRATLNRWIERRLVRTALVKGQRLMLTEDLECVRSLRAEGKVPAPNIDAEIDKIATTAAAMLPVMTDAQKSRLSAILAQCA